MGKERIGEEWSGWDRKGMEWNGLCLGVSGLKRKRFFYNYFQGEDRIGLEGSGKERIGEEWKGMERTGQEWSGMDWKGLEWNGMVLFKMLSTNKKGMEK